MLSVSLNPIFDPGAIETVSDALPGFTLHRTLLESTLLNGSTPAGLVGAEGIFILLEPDRRGGGYVSPRASAAALRRSDSALLGRPRLRGFTRDPDPSPIGLFQADEALARVQNVAPARIADTNLALVAA